jgi:hypothetical protein
MGHSPFAYRRARPGGGVTEQLPSGFVAVSLGPAGVKPTEANPVAVSLGSAGVKPTEANPVAVSLGPAGVKPTEAKSVALLIA